MGSRPNAIIATGAGLLALALSACGGGAAPEAKAPDAKGSADAGGGQVALGAKLYGANCAGCHGAGGEGADAPALVGKTALPLDPPATAKYRKSQFHTGADVFAFVKANMPPKKGGSLTDAEYAAILAFDLKANGVDMTRKTVDTSNAASFVIHP